MGDFQLFGTGLFGEPVKQAGGPLARRFEMPPFSVLNARDGAWRERKRAWLALGIESEIGRNCEDFAIGDKAKWDAAKAATSVSQRLAPGGGGGGCWRGGPATASSVKFGHHTVASGQAMELAGGETASHASGTSIFDPVLCELAYRWFCPPGGQVVDPFAGGSVRGIVASLLGFKYWGCDLSAVQIAANEQQRQQIAPDAGIAWTYGDALNLLPAAPEADFIFSCPPYGDLERYSDDPRDLSTMEYHGFLAAYKRIIMRCAEKLRQNHLACFVVGDFRDRKTGNYRGFVADTINAFRECGMALYNDAVLVTAIGSLPIRVSAQFEASRKLGKTHQNVLVFAKGTPGRTKF